MQQKTIFSILLVLSIAIGIVHCQSEGEGGDSLWKRFKKMVKEFTDTMRDLFKEMTKEIEARTQDMSSWTKEMFDSFKVKIKEWINQTGASNSEREEMTNYLERMRMPTEEPKKK